MAACSECGGAKCDTCGRTLGHGLIYMQRDPDFVWHNECEKPVLLQPLQGPPYADSLTRSGIPAGPLRQARKG